MIDVVKLLLNNNIKNLDIVSNNMTPLIWTIYKYENKMASDILKHGNCNVSYVDNLGNTALIYACINGRQTLAIELIRTKESNPRVLNKSHKTAFDYACDMNLQLVLYEMILHEYITVKELYDRKPEWIPDELLCISSDNEVTEIEL
jgi:ankyrin repeat protein